VRQEESCRTFYFNSGQADAMKPFIKYLLAGCGFLSLAIGVTGIFVPILPTTPFLLIAAACFFRSSDRMYRWLTGHRVFGSYIMGFRRYGAVSVRAKVVSIVTLWTVIGFSAVFAAEVLWLRIALAAIALGVSVYLLSLRTLTAEMKRDLRSSQDPRPRAGP
jgi:uncharacterized membrane protein YbaN (DUF454 family)